MRKLLLLLCLCLPLAAQVPDPPFDQPGAKENAEMRFAINWLFLGGGYMPPPVGWDCVPLFGEIGDPSITYLYAFCEPNPALVQQQQAEADEWLRRLARERSARVRSAARE